MICRWLIVLGFFAVIFGINMTAGTVKFDLIDI